MGLAWIIFYIIINRIMSDKEHVSIVVCGHVDSGNCCVFVFLCVFGKFIDCGL